MLTDVKIGNASSDPISAFGLSWSPGEVKTVSEDVYFANREEVELNPNLYISYGNMSNTGATSTLSDIRVTGWVVGNYNPGDTIASGTDVTEVLRNILNKTIAPTYTQPTFSISPVNAANIESGVSVQAIVNLSWAQNDAGALINYARGATTVPASTNTWILPTFFTIYNALGNGEPDSHTVSVDAVYGEGAIKNDSDGNPSPLGHVAAGTIRSSAVYRAYRKAFYGVVPDTFTVTSAGVRALNSSMLNPVEGTSFNISVVAGNKTVVFAYPAYLSAPNSVFSVLMNANITDVFTESSISVLDAAGLNAINYRVFIYTALVPFPTTDTFTVII